MADPVAHAEGRGARKDAANPRSRLLAYSGTFALGGLVAFVGYCLSACCKLGLR